MKFIVLCLLVLVVVSCNYILVDKGPLYIYSVKNISRSKDLGIFIHEFNPINIKINDTLNLEIVSAWVEHNIYTTDIENKYMKKEDWVDSKEWKLKKDFNPINKGHLSFIVKGDFRKKYKTYDDNWHLEYCEIIETRDTSFSNNFTYFETYGPKSYDSLTNKIDLNFEYYEPSKDTTKYGEWFAFGKFNLIRK